jgi:hypothetical protein
MLLPAVAPGTNAYFMVMEPAIIRYSKPVTKAGSTECTSRETELTAG